MGYICYKYKIDKHLKKKITERSVKMGFKRPRRIAQKEIAKKGTVLNKTVAFSTKVFLHCITHFLHIATNECTDTNPVRSPPDAWNMGAFQYSGQQHICTQNSKAELSPGKTIISTLPTIRWVVIQFGKH